MKTVEIDEDVFIDMLWDRVSNNPFGDSYDDDFWKEAFERLSESGWMDDPAHNDPKYIVDNIIVNGEIVAEEDAKDNYDLEGKTFEEWVESKGGEIVAGYGVLNWGL